MSIHIKERHLIERYLQGELSGIELEDFKNRLSLDNEFNHEVDLLKIIYSGVHRARQEQLEKKILNSVKYRKPTVPFALKLTITFLIITGAFISLWFYAGKETEDQSRKKPWYSFLNKNTKTEKSKSSSKAKGNEISKPIINSEEAKKVTSDTLQSQSAESTANELSQTDSMEIQNGEEIVVKQDQLMITVTLPVNDKSANEKQNTDNSLTADASQKIGHASDLPEMEIKAKDYEVEFWISPINYRGYKMSKNKILLFGIEEPDAVKLYRVNEMIYMTYMKGVYELESTSDFKPYQKLRESDIPASIK